MDDEIKVTVVLTVTPWQGAIGDPKRKRGWFGGPPCAVDDTAAQIERKSGFWPFKKWEWAIWAPINESAIEEGSAPTEDDAMKAADAALLRYAQGVSA